MNRPIALHLATPEDAVETTAQKVQRLQLEAKAGAREHSRGLIAMVDNLGGVAADIAAAGEPYPPGIVNEARVLAEDCARRVETMTAILNRSGR